MLTIFQFFATKTDASKLRMLSGSPKERLLQPILDYIEARGGRLHIRWGCRSVLPTSLSCSLVQDLGPGTTVLCLCAQGGFLQTDSPASPAACCVFSVVCSLRLASHRS